MSASLNTWFIIFFLAAAQGIFLAFVLFITKSPDKKNLLLGLIILLYSVSLLDNICFWMKCYENNPHLLGVSMSFPLFYGPLFYLYFREAFQAGQISWKRDWIHLVIPILLIGYLVPYYTSSASEKLLQILTWNLNPINALLIPLIKTVSLLGYLVLCVGLIRKYEVKTELRILEWKNWLSQILVMFILFIVAYLTYDILILSGLATPNSDYIIALVSALTIYFVGYLGYSKSKLLNGMKAKEVKYSSTTLTKTASRQLFSHISHYVESSKIYTDSNLRLPGLADKLSITPHQLSQVINEQSGKNFSDFINWYRIEEAKKQIKGSNQINHLALDVGFNNKTSFYQAFKKFVGCSPLEYKSR